MYLLLRRNNVSEIQSTMKTASFFLFCCECRMTFKIFLSVVAKSMRLLRGNGDRTDPCGELVEDEYGARSDAINSDPLGFYVSRNPLKFISRH